MNIHAKILKKVLANEVQKHLKGIILDDQVRFNPGIQGFLNICRSISVLGCMNKLKHKKPYRHLNGCRKSFWQNSPPTYDKTSPETGNRGNQPQDNMDYIWQTHNKHHSQCWITESTSSKISNKTRSALSFLLFNIVLKVLVMVIREVKEIKGMNPNWKRRS